MLKQSPSRNYRSKGFKVKHFIQISILLAICIWFLYQVKHSHDKKKAYNESSEKITERVQSEQELLSIGRKGLHPRIEETISGNEKGEEDEGDEETKSEDNVDEVRGEDDEMGEDLIDENDDKDREEENEEELEIEEKENLNEEETLSDDHDILESDSQEAREEHYRQDDASSAVVHNSETVSSDSEDAGLRKVKEEGQDNIINSREKIIFDEVRLNEGEEKTSKDGGFEKVLQGNEERDDFNIDVTNVELNASSLRKFNGQTMTQESAALKQDVNSNVLPEAVQASFNLTTPTAKEEMNVASDTEEGSTTSIGRIHNGNYNSDGGKQDSASANEIVDAVQNKPFGTFVS